MSRITGRFISCLLLSVGLSSLMGADRRDRSGEAFQDEPKAHALYDKMADTFQGAKTLSWTSDYRWGAEKSELGHAVYRIWLKKPNYARVEVTPTRTNKVSGILVGDGDHFWIYWPDGRPRYGWEYEGNYAREYEKYRMTSYRKEPSPMGHHSIAHKTDALGGGMSMTILDPSIFHGYTDCLQPYLDGVRRLDSEKVEREQCDVIEVSFMKHQRSWILWLSQKDHLPRKLKEVVRVSHEVITEETWSEVRLNQKMQGSLFQWTPPKGWKEWVMPPIEEGLLKKGTPAPDFECKSVEGRKIKLSDYRGNVVWLYKWRCG